MRVIPVIDLMEGQVVRGVAGRREQYRPVQTRLAASAEATEIATAFRDRLGLAELYLADLDAIAGGEPAWGVYDALLSLGMHLWIDAGLRDVSSARQLRTARVQSIVAGLETLPGPQTLAELVEQIGPGRLAFSLDLKGGKPIGRRYAWRNADALGVADQAVQVGVQRIIVLDLAQVGVSEGIGTEPLCVKLRSQFTDLELIAGGGIRGVDDLKRLNEAGLDAVLVASALHDGRIGGRELESLSAV